MGTIFEALDGFITIPKLLIEQEEKMVQHTGGEKNLVLRQQGMLGKLF